MMFESALPMPSANDARVTVGVEQDAELLRSEDDRTTRVRILGRRALTTIDTLRRRAGRVRPGLEGLVERREDDRPLAEGQVRPVAQLALHRRELLRADAFTHERDELRALLRDLRREPERHVLVGQVLRSRLDVLDRRHDLDAGRRDEELGVTALNDDALSETERVARRLGGRRHRRRRLVLAGRALIDDGARESRRLDH